MKKKRTASDIRKLASDGADVLTSLTFKSSKKKEKMVLQLIADEMDENGVGFKEALVNLILSEAEVVVTKKTSRKQPKIVNSKIEVYSKAEHASKIEESAELSSNDDSLDNQSEQASPDPVLTLPDKPESTEIKENQKKPEEKKKELSAEDKESLKQRLLNSYHI